MKWPKRARLKPSLSKTIRLGRHRTQTALFIDHLREHDVRVLSATENIDTFNETMIPSLAWRGPVNDFYVRDGSRRVRTDVTQKEGIVITPPFGYFKDKNTKRVVIVEEAAETIRLITAKTRLRLKVIARMLNERNARDTYADAVGNAKQTAPCTQDHISKKYSGRDHDRSYSQDESYVGTLICHKSARKKSTKNLPLTEPKNSSATRTILRRSSRRSCGSRRR